jgi:riboflavin synthase
VGRLVGREALGDAQRVRFEVPEVLAPMMAPKGSVTIDGVSLTVNGATGTEFDVVLVPWTRAETLFDERSEGAKVNIEVDVLAKYVARLLGKPGVDGKDPQNPGQAEGLTLETLRGSGYL